jgi:hypothetical protein
MLSAGILLRQMSGFRPALTPIALFLKRAEVRGSICMASTYLVLESTTKLWLCRYRALGAVIHYDGGSMSVHR